VFDSERASEYTTGITRAIDIAMTTTTKVVGTIIIAFLCYLAFTAAITIPRERIEAQERTAREARMAEETKEAERTFSYNACMYDAYQAYSQTWDNECITRGLKADCTLQRVVSDRLEDNKRNAESNCVAMYK
jgi:hypothetical protein